MWSRRRLMVVFALAAGLRLLVLASVAHQPAKLYTPDSLGYERLAMNLLHRGTFSRDTQSPFRPEAQRTPLYPIFLAAVFAVAGPSPVAAVVAQILLGSLTAVLTFALGRQLAWPPGTALGAALLVAIEPVSILTSNLLLTETLFTTLLVAGIGILARYWATRDGRWLLAAVLALAAANLTRPVSQFLPLALIPVFALAAERGRIRALVAAGVIVAVLTSALTYAWAYRNYRQAGLLTLSTVFANNLTFFNAREVLARAEGVTQEEARRRIVARVEAATAAQSLPPAERLRVVRQLGVSILLRHPGLTVVAVGKAAARILVDPGFTLACTLLDPDSPAVECFPGRASMNEPGLLRKAVGKFREMRPRQQLTLVGSTLLLGALYLGASVGMARLLRARRWLGLALLLVVIGYFVGLSAYTGADSRLRIPIVPFLALLAVAGLGRPGSRPLPRWAPPCFRRSGV